MRTESPLFTDQYELVMAHAYWLLNKAEQEAVFQLYFRRHPFESNYTICCGLERVIHFLQNWHFSTEDINYLSQLTTPTNLPLFNANFLIYLSELRFTGDIDAIPEGNIVFPHQPLLRIKAPLLQCQLLETSLINLVQFSSLIATKATRVYQAAYPDPIVDFGLRRAQGPDGGLLASRAAYIGGCAATSNTLAGQLYGIPIQGTQAHSWIMSFTDELTAFKEFTRALPHQAILLVDTYNTYQGIENAIQTGMLLQKQGYLLQGIRLDSGDLAELSQYARNRLDKAGFTGTKILASGDLDEYSIARLKAAGAKIDIWGVGTRLITAYDHPALDMVYKLAAVGNTGGSWDYKIKFSDSISKKTVPGLHQVRRYFQQQHWLGDIIYDVEHGLSETNIFSKSNSSQDLLIPIFRSGKLVYSSPQIGLMRDFCILQLNNFFSSNSGSYTVHYDAYLLALEKQLANNLKGEKRLC